MTNKLKLVAQILDKDPNVDTMSNHFVFETDDTPPYPNIGAAFSAIESFYSSIGTGGGAPLSFYMPRSLDFGTSHSIITAYDITGHLNGTPAGAPVAMENFVFGGGTAPSDSHPCPEGCAATLSYRADYGSDVEFAPGARPRARDRNRLYIPINSTTLQLDTTTKRTEFTPSFITDCLASMFTLSNTHTSGGTHYNWRVWSRKAAAVKVITELWMDDRPDYQRRRTDPTPGSRTFRAASSV